MAERHLWRIVFQNFINSLKPRPIRGNNVGKDYIGNKYFEIPANPSIGKRKPVRWYDPPKGLDFSNRIPAEWDSWLRMKRKEPPTEEEVSKNLAIAEMKRKNAAIIEAKRLAEGGSLPVPAQKGAETFPRYAEYDTGDPERGPRNC